MFVNTYLPITGKGINKVTTIQIQYILPIKTPTLLLILIFDPIHDRFN